MRSAVRLLPLLALYATVALAFQRAPENDEVHYLAYAANLLHGHWYPSGALRFWYGPGYPIMIAPLVGLGAPLAAARLLNAALVFAGVLYFRSTARFFVGERAALLAAWAMGLYPPLMRHLHRLMTEPLAVFCVCAAAYHLCALGRRQGGRRTSVAAAAASLAVLALARPLFGHTLLLLALGLAAVALVRRAPAWRDLALAHAAALVLCLPYLAHTWLATGTPFYWASSGGRSIYWMAAARGDELGDRRYTYDAARLAGLPESDRRFLAAIESLDVVDRDRAYWRAAASTAREHPRDVLRNWCANVGRLLFSYPFAETPQKLSTYFYALPNGFLVFLCLLCAWPTARRWRLVPPEIATLLAFAAVSLGGISLVSAVARYFIPLAPILALWVVFTAGRLVTIRLAEERSS